MIRFLLYCCVIASLFGSTYGEQSEISNSHINRINYGIYLRRLATVKMVSDKFLHSFVVRLPPMYMAAKLEFPLLYCSDNNTRIKSEKPPVHCSAHSPFTAFLHQIHGESFLKLHTTIQDTYVLFETAPKLNGRLVKKGLINALGHAISFLTGLTTSDDLQNLQSTMTKLISDSSTTTRYLTHQITDLSSIFEVTNKRVDTVMTLIQEQNALFKNFSSAVDNTIEKLIDFTQILFQKLYSINKMNAAMTEYLQSLERLTTGMLDPAIISPEHLDRVLTDIELHLQKSFPNLQLITKSKAFYYSTRSSFTFKMGDSLVIFLHIPLTSWKQNFNVYKTEILSLPIPGNYSHATRISDLPKFLIVSEDQKHYVEMAHLPVIQNNLIQFEYGAINSNQNSCITAILQNIPTLISKQCKIQFLKDGLTPQVLQLSSTSVVLIKIPQYRLIFPNSTQQTFTGCDRLCVTTFPCGSTFVSDYYVFPAKMSSCENQTIESQTLYPTNLAILYALFNSSELTAFHSSLLLSEELSVQIPKIKFANIQQHQHLEEDRQSKIDLDKLSKQLVADQMLFDTQINALTHSISASFPTRDDFDINSWKDWFILIISIFIIILFIITGCLFRKLHLISTLSIASPLVIPTTEALQPRFTLNPLIHPKLLVTQPLTPIINSTLPAFDFQIDIIIQSKFFQTFLLLTILAILVAIAIKLYRPKQYKICEWKTVVAFNIASPTSMITLTTPPLPDDISQYRFYGDNSVREIHIMWGACPKIKIDWHVTIQHTWTVKPVPWEWVISVNWNQALHIKRIIRSRFHVIPYLINGSGKTSALMVESLTFPFDIRSTESLFIENIEMVPVIATSTPTSGKGNEVGAIIIKF